MARLGPGGAPRLLPLVALVLAPLLPACSTDPRVLSIGVDAPGAPPVEARVGESLRLRATLSVSGEAASTARVVSNAPELAWRATPKGIAVFSPGGGPTDPVNVTFLKEGTATIWATFERLESTTEMEIVVKPETP